MCLHVPCEQVTFWTSVVTVVAHQLSLHALRCPLRRHFDNFLRGVSICRSNGLAFCERLAALFFEVINRHVSIALRNTLLVGLTHDQYVTHLQLKVFRLCSASRSYKTYHRALQYLQPQPIELHPSLDES